MKNEKLFTSSTYYIINGDYYYHLGVKLHYGYPPSSYTTSVITNPEDVPGTITTKRSIYFPDCTASFSFKKFKTFQKEVMYIEVPIKNYTLKDLYEQLNALDFTRLWRDLNDNLL